LYPFLIFRSLASLTALEEKVKELKRVSEQTKQAIQKESVGMIIVNNGIFFWFTN
jgi:hypothetical protein